MKTLKLKRIEPLHLAKFSAYLGASFSALKWILPVLGSMIFSYSFEPLLVGIADIIASFVFGYLGGYFLAVIMNFVLRKVGPILLTFEQGKLGALRKLTLRRIDPASFAKYGAGYAAIIFGTIAVFVLVISTLFGSFLAAFKEGFPSVSTILGYGILGASVFLALITICAYIVNWITAAISNFALDKVGGVEFGFTKQTVLKHVGKRSFARFQAVFLAFIGILAGGLLLFFAALSGTSALDAAIAAVALVVLLAVFGYIFGWLYALILNFVFEMFSGIKVELN